jgi:hypothetical protein
MKMNGAGLRIGVTALALAISLLTRPTLPEAQRVAGCRALDGWRSVAPVLGAPTSISFWLA